MWAHTTKPSSTRKLLQATVPRPHNPFLIPRRGSLGLHPFHYLTINGRYSTACVILAVVVILAVKGFRLLQITGASESPALNIPWAYVYAAFPIGMSLMAFRYGQMLLGLLRGVEPAAVTGAPSPPSPESPI